MPYQAGYAFLVAYRFVPAFQTEFQKIRMAHEVRGVHSPEAASAESGLRRGI